MFTSPVLSQMEKREKWNAKLRDIEQNQKLLNTLIDETHVKLNTPTEVPALGPEKHLSNIDMVMSGETDVHTSIYNIATDYKYHKLPENIYNNSVLQICANDPEMKDSTVSAKINVRRVTKTGCFCDKQNTKENNTIIQPFSLYVLDKGKDLYSNLLQAYAKQGSIKYCIDALNSAFNEDYYTFKQCDTHNTKNTFALKADNNAIPYVTTHMSNYIATSKKDGSTVKVKSFNVLYNRNSSEPLFITESVSISTKDETGIEQKACIVMSNFDNNRTNNVPKTASWIFGLPSALIGSTGKNVLNDAIEPLTMGHEEKLVTKDGNAFLHCTACLKSLNWNADLHETETRGFDMSNFKVDKCVSMPGLRCLNVKINGVEKEHNLCVVLASVEDCQDSIKTGFDSNLNTNKSIHVSKEVPQKTTLSLSQKTPCTLKSTPVETKSTQPSAKKATQPHLAKEIQRQHLILQSIPENTTNKSSTDCNQQFTLCRNLYHGVMSSNNIMHQYYLVKR